MCDCRTRIEENLVKRFQEQAPDAINHKARLEGYSLILGDSITEKGCMPFKFTAEYPVKRQGGGMKVRTTNSNLIFTYCPFCGQKYESN